MATNRTASGPLRILSLSLSLSLSLLFFSLLPRFPPQFPFPVSVSRSSTQHFVFLQLTDSSSSRSINPQPPCLDVIFCLLEFLSLYIHKPTSKFDETPVHGHRTRSNQGIACDVTQNCISLISERGTSAASSRLRGRVSRHWLLALSIHCRRAMRARQPPATKKQPQ